MCKYFVIIQQTWLVEINMNQKVNYCLFVQHIATKKMEIHISLKNSIKKKTIAHKKIKKIFFFFFKVAFLLASFTTSSSSRNWNRECCGHEFDISKQTKLSIYFSRLKRIICHFWEFSNFINRIIFWTQRVIFVFDCVSHKLADENCSFY